MSLMEKKVDALVRLALSESDIEKEFLLKSLRDLMDKPFDFPDIVKDVRTALLEIGVPDRLLGYKYILHCVAHIIENGVQYADINKVLYPDVAKEFGTTPSRVERAIRHSIEVAWDRIPMEVSMKYFGNTINGLKGKPTNHEFLVRLANYLRGD